MTTTKYDPLKMLQACSRWRMVWTPPDRRPIYKWAHDNIELNTGTIKGKFSTRQSRWMEAVFDDLQYLSVRRVHLRKAVKIGGSLIAEIFLQWIISNDPENVSWTMQNDVEMKDHLMSRLWPLMEDGCWATRTRLPPVGPYRTLDRIHFGSWSIVFNAANENSQQDKDIRYKINDEIWLPKWADIYDQAIARVEAFERIGLSKIFNISQAGVRGDIEDGAFTEGHQAELSIKCPMCAKSTPLQFSIDRPGRPRAGVIWNSDARNADGYLNTSRAVETCRYECAECAHGVVESEAMRRQWNETQHWIPQNLQAPPQYRSYHVESLCMKRMPDLVAQFCSAFNMKRRGFDEKFKVFVQQQRALPWLEVEQTIDLSRREIEPYRYSDYAKGEPWPMEVARAMTIDRQKTHFWVEIRAWRQNGDSRQLYFGRVNTVEDCRILQATMKIADNNVFEDVSYDGPAVYDDCLRFREKGKYGWIPLRGTTQRAFMHLDRNDPKKKDKRFYSEAQQIEHKLQRLYEIQFSADNCKNILARLLGGTGARWDVPNDVSAAYTEQIQAERKVETHPGYFTWQKFPASAPNHGLDTSNMQVVFALIRGFLAVEVVVEGGKTP